MKQRVSVFVALSSIILSHSYCHVLAVESPLATAQVSAGGGARSVFNTVKIPIGYFPDPDDFLTWIYYPLFEDYSLTSDDVGRTFTATAGSDPDFAGFVSLASNGNNDVAMVGTEIEAGWLGGGGPFETDFWSPHPPGGNGIDLQGFQIGRITMTVDSLTMESPGRDPNGDGVWTSYDFEGTLRVYTLVPEPTTFALLGLGSLALVVARRRK